MTSADRPAGLSDRYRLGEVIGTGGMGKVYRAHDTTLGRDVAIKVIEAGVIGTNASQPRDRFVREARAAARLAHPNIVAVHDVDPDAGWLVMDLVEGQPLRELAGAGPLSPGKVRSIAEQVLSALDAAHAAGVIHRDIKPSNVIVDDDGKVTLVDFGVARLVDAEMTKTGESLGTPAYMAPEQLRGGAVDARTDLYGLAATLFELVTGERMVAFETPQPDTLAKVRAACGRERGLARLIERCLQAAPEQRIGSAREAMQVLRDRRSQGRRALVLGLAAVVLATGGVVAWRMTRHRAPDPRRAELFVVAQRGEHEKAGLLLDQYIADHPDDGDARAMQHLNHWWESGRIVEPLAGSEHFTDEARDMLHGLALLAARRESHAVAYLEDAARQHPQSVQILYALGEARWHGGQLERGVETLEAAFALDPSWQMALHHVLEFRLSRGATASLRPIAAAMRALDPTRGAVLDCQIAIADRKPTEAATIAREALARFEPLPQLYVCLMQAQILANDLAGAERSAKETVEKWPIDLREWGAQALASELLLYHGRLDEYLAVVKPGEARQKIITLALWRPMMSVVEDPQTADAIRGQPIVPASQTLSEHARGRDPTIIYEDAPELELRAYGRGLAAELRKDLAGAIADYRRALATPSKGDSRMLIAYQLAKALAASGDTAAAGAACEEVIAPHYYIPYRAALLPDCLLWTGDPARWKQLVDAWTGGFEHPAVVEARRRLGSDR